MTIFSSEEEAAVEDECLGERGRRHQDLEPPPSAGTENQDLGMVETVVWPAPSEEVGAVWTETERCWKDRYRHVIDSFS